MLKKGAGRDVVFHTHAHNGARNAPDPRPSVRKPKRKCRFCGRPLLFVAAPLVLVIAFVFRGQQSVNPGDRAAAAGYIVALQAETLGSDVSVTITVRPAGRLVSRFLRAAPAPAGSAVTAALYTSLSPGGPVLLFGATPTASEGVATLSTRVPAAVAGGRREGTPVSAQVSIAGQTVSLATRVREGA